MELDISENQISLLRSGGQQREYSEMLSIWPVETVFLGFFFLSKMQVDLCSSIKVFYVHCEESEKHPKPHHPEIITVTTSGNNIQASI